MDGLPPGFHDSSRYGSVHAGHAASTLVQLHTVANEAPPLLLISQATDVAKATDDDDGTGTDSVDVERCLPHRCKTRLAAGGERIDL